MIKPLPHQVDAIKAVTTALKTVDRTHMVMACGTGKTLTSLWIAEKLAPKSIVIFVPSLALISQFMKEWIKHTKWQKYEMLAVCSDKSITQNIEEESILLDEIDFPVTNEPEKIKAFLKGKTTNIIFCTYHSANLLGGLHIELGIFDEAHKTAGYNKLLFGFGLLDSEIKIDKRIFMTATPRHGAPKMSKGGEVHELYSMDDEALYGKRCFELGFRKAIELGLICDYKVIISVIAKNTDHAFNKEFEIPEKAISLQKAIAESGVKKIITFHSSIAHAKAFAAYLSANKMHPNIMHINSHVNISERSQMMERFRDAKQSVITNAKCLTEGVDVPTVDMVAFLNPKSSKIDIVQAIGRALRTSPGKERGYIFLPLLINNMETMEQEIAANEFKTVWDILNALMEQDSDLADTVKFIGKGGGQQEGRSLGDDPFLKFLSFNNTNLKKLIEVKVLNKLVSNWDRMFQEFLDYKQKYGTTKILTEHINSDLNKWMKQQRNNKTRLAAHRIKLLTDAGFDWNPLQKSRPWAEVYEELAAFVKTHGCLPPSRLQNRTLYSFLERNRELFKKGKLNTHKYEALKALGVKFYQKILYKDGAPESEHNNMLWGEKYKDLCKYKEEHGTTNIPQHKGDHRSLAKWCCAQREAYKEGKLHAYRREMLLNIDFDFNPLETAWQTKFAEFKKYKDNEDEMPEDLKSWCSYQRRAREKGILSEERIKLLTDANFRFHNLNQFLYKTSIIDEHPRWVELWMYYMKHKTWSVPKKNQALSSMTKKMREAYREGRMHQKSIEMLNKLGFPWEPEAAKIAKKVG